MTTTPGVPGTPGPPHPSPDARAAAAAARRAWMPRQHGAWAMLLLPIILGTSVGRPSPWQLLLTGAAVTGYLTAATFQAWSRARHSAVYRRPLVTYGAAFAVLSAVLVVAFPALLLAGLVAGPAALIVAGDARPGTRRDIAGSLAQVAIALTLVPAAAWVGGDWTPAPVAVATAVAAGYLGGTVLVVRSVIRERSNPRFAVLSGAVHVGLLAAAAAWLTPAWMAIAALLAVRAIAFPILQRRLAGTPRPLRPIHLGIAEIVASLLIALAAIAVPLG